MASHGDITTFNSHHAYPEGLVRGYRSGFLTDGDYHHLTQCESLEDLKMNLAETDYADFLANETSTTPALVQEKALNKMVQEFQYLRAQAVGPLAQFMDFITYEYMIENVMLLLSGTLNGRDVDELMEQCHPLGMFKESTMRNIPSFESNPSGYADLYETVLVDTPVGPYFSQFLEDSSERIASAAEMRTILEEVQIEILRNSLMKLYLEDFYAFCMDLGHETGVIMGEILKARADRYAINITLNSFGTPLNEPTLRDSDRRRLYPSFGFLYPAGTELLANVADENQLGAALQSFTEYRDIWEKHMAEGASGGFSIDDAFYERDVRMLELAFEGQFHFAVFYAYTKLKEQEIRNLVWISECILQHQKDQIDRFIPVFSKAAPWRASSAAAAGGGGGH